MSNMAARLQARLGLDRQEFSRGLRGARAEAQGFGQEISRLGTNLRTALGVSVAGVGLATVMRTLRSSVRDMAQIGDQARQAGMSLRAFQEWRFVGDQNRVGMDLIADGFRELSLRADEWIATGGGSAAEAFQRLGFDAEDLARRLQDPSEMMLEIARRMQRLNSAARIRVSDEMFGGAFGERFVQIIERGAEGLERTIARAHELGTVFEDNLVHRADLVERRYAQLTNRLQAWVQRIAVETIGGAVQTPTDTLVEIFGSLERARAELGDAIVDNLVAIRTELREVEGAVEGVRDVAFSAEELARSAQWAEGELAGMVLALTETGNTGAADEMRAIYDALVASRAEMDAHSISSDEFRDRLSSAMQQAVDLVGALGDVDGASFSRVISNIGNLISQLGRARDQAAALKAELPGAATPEAAPDEGHPWQQADRNSPRPNSRPIDWLPGDSDRTSSRSGGAGRSESEYRRLTESIREEISVLQLEAAAILASAAAGAEYAEAIEYARQRAELMNAVQRDGQQITPELQAQIDELARAYVAAGQAAETAADQMRAAEENAQRGRDAMADLFTGIVQGGDAARQALARLLTQLAQVQLQRAMMGLGGGGGFFGWLGGALKMPGNANGTSNWRGGITAVNERGGEIMNLPRGTQIIPHDISKRMAEKSAAQPASITVNVEGANGDQHVVRLVEQGVSMGLRQYDRGLPDRMRQIDANSRVRR